MLQSMLLRRVCLHHLSLKAIICTQNSIVSEALLNFDLSPPDTDVRFQHAFFSVMFRNRFGTVPEPFLLRLNCAACPAHSGGRYSDSRCGLLPQRQRVRPPVHDGHNGGGFRIRRAHPYTERVFRPRGENTSACRVVCSDHCSNAAVSHSLRFTESPSTEVYSSAYLVTMDINSKLSAFEGNDAVRC